MRPRGCFIAVLLRISHRAGADIPCDVTFRNVGSISSGSIQISRAPVGLFREWDVQNQSELSDWIKLIGVADLRLKGLPTAVHTSGSEGLQKGSKLVRAGDLQIFQHGPKELQGFLEARQHDNVEFPFLLQFRLDTVLGTLGPSEQISESTFVNHRFELESLQGEPVLVTVQQAGDIHFHVDASKAVHVDRTGALQRDPKQKEVMQAAVAEAIRRNCSRDLAGYDEDIAFFCGPQHDDRLFVRSRFQLTEGHQARELARRSSIDNRSMAKASQDLPHFTKAGYATLDGPRPTVDKLHAYYLSERLRLSKPEANEPFSPIISSFQSDTWGLQLSMELGEELDAGLRPQVAAWLGLQVDDLERSSKELGMRIYHRGALMNRHIDMVETHPIGVIIHAGHLTGNHSEKGESWPFIIQGHDGVNHKLAPDTQGRVVMYEAATCPHWRDGPFPGREFANVFLHYKPRGWPERYRKLPAASGQSEL